jgi:hypothetical protein
MIVQRANLRRYFPGADGDSNPLMWFVLDPAYEGHDGGALCIAGPFRTKREAFEAAERERIEFLDNENALFETDKK